MGAKEPYRFRVLKCEICDILSVWSVQLVCMFCAWCVVYLFDFVVRQQNRLLNVTDACQKATKGRLKIRHTLELDGKCFFWSGTNNLCGMFF